MSKILLVLVLFVLSTSAKADNNELAQLAAEDQAVRAGTSDPRSDDARRTRVLELIASGNTASPQDSFNAALVLQHTGLVSCDGEIKSLSAENYLLAHFLFKRAMAGGIKGANYLVAASIDRYLSFTVGQQRYGTNRLIDQDTGREVLVPIDRSATDAERAIYGVEPLKQLLKRFSEQQKGG